MLNKKKKLALVLSGGSARGLAHIGVLEVLEENHVPIDVIVGTSIGALIGGIYAAGSLKEFKEEVVRLTHHRITSLFFSRRFKRMNADNNVPIEKLLKKFIKGKKIEDLSISFSAIATDLKTGEEIFIEKGDLLKAILASIALPGLFKPIEFGNKLLVDGGVVDPLPQQHAHLLAEKVIAVNAMPKDYVYKKEGDDVFEVLSRVASIMTNNILNLENVISFKEYNKNNLVFMQLNTGISSPFDFYEADKLIEIGRAAAKKNIKDIIRMIKS